MTDDERTGQTRAAKADPVANVVALPRARPGQPPRRGLLRRRRPRRRKMRWLRLLAIMIPIAFLALISFVFGIVLAFEPQIRPDTQRLYKQFQTTANSLNTLVYGDAASGHKQIATLTSHNNEFSVTPQNVPLVMDHAIVAIEDKRFYTESGVDIKGIVRAFLADVLHTGAGTQGASTITEQFVKRALVAEGRRTLFEKLKEAGMAFQLSHLWSKQQILAAYLNTAYYGSGAYGLEAAAKTYFGNDPGSPLYHCGAHPSNGDPASLCVTNLTADESALLAAAVNAPSDYNDLLNHRQAEDRRNLVLQKMAQQGYLGSAQAQADSEVSLPTSAEVESPAAEATNPSDGYFTSWVAGQLVGHLGYPRIYGGGYEVDTTLDTDLQAAAQHIVDTTLPAGIGGPSAALVAIQTDNGEVRAMVGGYDYNQYAFNLATQAERQPGSAFKVFDLAAALEAGYGPNSEIYSGPFTYPAGSLWSAGLPAWTVHNDEGAFAFGYVPLSEALAVSDNSVFARLSLKSTVGPPKIAQVARDFGITTTMSLNPSMVIGGLQRGVTPLDMAHAYETIANGGQLETGTLTSYECAGGATNHHAWEGTPPGPKAQCEGPVGITSVKDPSDPRQDKTNRAYPIPVPYYSYADDQTEISMMRGVLSPIGTAYSASIPGVDAWGKTGTTSNYVDAWFVGSIPQVGKTPGLTVAVWVGYPNRFKEMTKNYGGKPVYGGTFPAQIWKAFMEQAMTIFDRRAHGESGIPKTSTGSSSANVGASSAAGSTAPLSTPTGATTPSNSTVSQQNGATTATQTGSTTGAGAATQSTTSNGPAVTGSGGSTVPSGGSTTATPPPSTSGSGSPGTTTGTPPSTGAGGGVSAPTGST
jgi:penicillin-binding protein 1A